MNGKARLAGFALCTVALVTVPSAGAASRSGSVVKVVDGDSVRVKVKGRTVKVDLLGIRAADDCGDSAAKLRSLLRRGAKVRFVADGSRRGAYVFRGSKLVNREMLAAGLAKLAPGASRLREGKRLVAAEKSA